MTYQRPAYEEVSIAHGASTLTLRPTLRAAATLEARFSFAGLYRALDEGSFTVISEIILVAASSRRDAAAFLLSEAAGRPLSSFLGAVSAPLAILVSMLVPVADPEVMPAKHPGKVIPWAEFFDDQFQRATGWLGWTPEQAWSATPTEIERAYSGHIGKLKAIHGSEENGQPNKVDTDLEQAKRNVEAGLDPQFDRDGLRALKMKIAGGRA